MGAPPLPPFEALVELASDELDGWPPPPPLPLCAVLAVVPGVLNSSSEHPQETTINKPAIDRLAPIHTR
jgi:hypothetical protein